MSGMDWKKAIGERDGRIAELEVRGESDRIGFQLQLAGVRNVKATRAVLTDPDGDVDALKESEPWLPRTLLFQSRRTALRDFLMRAPVPTRARR